MIQQEIADRLREKLDQFRTMIKHKGNPSMISVVDVEAIINELENKIILEEPHEK